jgi:hypothetical protein
MSNLVVAKVAKHSTADGVAFFFADVPIGAEYLADLDTRRILDWRDLLTGIDTARESIVIIGTHSAGNPGRSLGYVPTELLDIPEGKL